MLPDSCAGCKTQATEARAWQVALAALVTALLGAAGCWWLSHGRVPLVLMAVKGGGRAVVPDILQPTDFTEPAILPEAELVSSKPALLNQSRCIRVGHPFSQLGEDEYAWRHFFYGKRGGRFLEMGAFNGCTFSNTLLFEAGAGWRGILIEASPRQSQTMNKMRPAAVRVNVGVCSSSSTVHYVEKGAVGGIVELMSDTFRETWKISKEGHIPIMCLPLRNLMADLQVRHVDFWSLDVEGGELSVLQTFDFQQVLVDVMVVETKESAHFDGIVSLLAANGFRLVERQKMNTWFVREGFTPSVDPNLTTASQPASSPPAAA